MGDHKNWKVSFERIQQAGKFLSGILPQTSLRSYQWLSEALECEVFLKLECMQPIGSFKIRGACFKISQLSEKEKSKGVIAASAGNHAQGVAWAARKFGVHATIVMPKGASLTKLRNTSRLGAEVILEGETYDEAFEAADALSKKRGLVFVHAYEDPDIIAGQGTCGLEIANQLPDADYVIGAIGGGGLMAGVGIALKGSNYPAKLIGCQAEGASSMVQSFAKGESVASDSVDTFADGVAVQAASEKMRQILVEALDDVQSASDPEIAAAVLGLLEKAKVVSEGAGAIPLAVLYGMREQIKGKKVVLIVSGGNIDVSILSRIIDLGLIRTGRRIRMSVFIDDRPGSLSKITECVAKQNASIVQVIHDRNAPSSWIDETLVDLTIETRGFEHTEQVKKALEPFVRRQPGRAEGIS